MKVQWITLCLIIFAAYSFNSKSHVGTVSLKYESTPLPIGIKSSDSSFKIKNNGKILEMGKFYTFIPQKYGVLYTEVSSSFFSLGIPRITDDIEELSIQEISEFAILDRYAHKYYGSFKIEEKDSILSPPLNDDFSHGVMIVHDNQKLDPKGEIQNANYKIISFKGVINRFPELIKAPSSYGPRTILS